MLEKLLFAKLFLPLSVSLALSLSGISVLFLTSIIVMDKHGMADIITVSGIRVQVFKKYFHY